MSFFIRRASAFRHHGCHRATHSTYMLSASNSSIKRICAKNLSTQQNSFTSRKSPNFIQKKPSILENCAGLLFAKTLQKRRYSKGSSLLQPAHIFKNSLSFLHSPRKRKTNIPKQKAFIHTTMEIGNLQSQKQPSKLLLLILAVTAVTAVLLAVNTKNAEAQETELPLVPLSDEELTQLADSLGISSAGLDHVSLKKQCFQVLVEACIKEEWEKISDNKSLAARLTDISGKAPRNYNLYNPLIFKSFIC